MQKKNLNILINNKELAKSSTKLKEHGFIGRKGEFSSIALENSPLIKKKRFSLAKNLQKQSLRNKEFIFSWGESINSSDESSVLE